MQRLTGNDANFLYQETPTTPQHTLKISVLDLKDNEFDLETVKQQFMATIHRIPALRWRMVPVPFGLHHPMAVEDPEFDINFHIRHVALPQPADWQALDDMIGQIASHPLDRDCPLWELWVVEGMAEGKAAFILKAHHAIADGQQAADQQDQDGRYRILDADDLVVVIDAKVTRPDRLVLRRAMVQRRFFAARPSQPIAKNAGK